MEKLEQLQKQLADTDAALDALLANDTLTEAQQAEHDRLQAERAKAVAAIKREQARLDRERERLQFEADAGAAAAARERADRTLAAVPRRLTAPDHPTQNGPPQGRARVDAEGRLTGFFEDTEERVTLQFGTGRDARRRLSYAEQRRANLRHLKAAGYAPGGEFKSFADFVRAGMAGHQTHAFQERHRRHFAAVQGMSEGVGGDGGYLVMPEYGGGIIDRVYGNGLWGRTDNYTVTGNSMIFLANAETSRATGSRHGGLRGYWLQGEGSTLTKSKPTLREITLRLAKLGVLVYLTQELIDDGGATLQEYVSRKASEEFEFMTGDALFNGTGVGQPLGVLNSPSLVSVAKETGQLAATIETENVEKMYARAFAPNVPSMSWFHNQDILPELNTMTLGIGTGGVPTYLPPGGVSAAPYGTLKGRPVEPTEFNATLGTQGDLVFADLGQILSISKGGVAQAVSMHVEFLSDQLALRFILRLNAGPWETSAITPYKGTATQSSFVTLDTRA